MNRQRLFLILGIGAVLGLGAASWMWPHRALAPVGKTQTPELTKVEDAKIPTPAPAPAPSQPMPAADLSAPVAGFTSRITKKKFGTYVTPQNSPVQPEKFTGYHTGVDAEYGDATGDVLVHAVAAGTVVSAGFVSGYGGVIVARHTIRGVPHLVLYGHLATSSLVANGARLTAGQVIGRLGHAYSAETDGEREHLHFSILAGTTLSYRGYVPTQLGLAGWVDPLSFRYSG